MSTIKDVADHAGVGVGTVSRVLNGAPGVSSPTLERVVRAIRELDYRPSPAARALSRRRSSTVAVTAPFLTRPSVVERVRGVVSALAGGEHDLQLATVETPAERERRLADAARPDRVGGAILISLAPTPAEAAALAAVEAPVVVVDSRVECLSCVSIDDVAGGRLAAEHLLGLGHRRIAFVGDSADERFRFTSSDDRLSGARAALADAGLHLETELVALGPHGLDEAEMLATLLLDREDAPTAVFAASDTQAVGVIRAAGAAGLRVPEDLSVIGFDDIELAGIIGLSTVSQPLFESGRLAGEMLLARLDGEGGGEPARVTLPLTLVQRSTTGPPRRAGP